MYLFSWLHHHLNNFEKKFKLLYALHILEILSEKRNLMLMLSKNMTVTVLEGLITKHNSYNHIESGKFG